MPTALEIELLAVQVQLLTTITTLANSLQACGLIMDVDTRAHAMTVVRGAREVVHTVRERAERRTA